MRHGLDRLQLRNADRGVNLGRVQVCMAQKLLDKANIGSVLQHQGAATVPEQVAAAFGDASLAHVLAKETRKVIGADRSG